MQRKRKQYGTIALIGNAWFSRYNETQNRSGTLTRVKVSHFLGDVTGKQTKHAPADIVAAHEAHMLTVNQTRIRPERTVSIRDFIEGVHLPQVERDRRVSTARGYRQLWENHLRPIVGTAILKDTICADAQAWFDEIGKKELAKNTLARLKSFLSGVFKNAARLAYTTNPNPCRDVLLNVHATKPKTTHAYDFSEIMQIAAVLAEPAATLFTFAAFSGLRRGELEGLRWEDVDIESSEMHVRRSLWNGVENLPKHREEDADEVVPLIPLLVERLTLHRLRDGNPASGPVFRNSLGHPIGINNLTNRSILPALRRCATCGVPKGEPHVTDDKHQWARDSRLPEWRGWHSCRRGLGSNLYHLGCPDLVIQQILRHADVATTQRYYVKVRKPDARKAMLKLDKAYAKTTGGQTLMDSYRTPNRTSGALPGSIN